MTQTIKLDTIVSDKTTYAEPHIEDAPLFPVIRHNQFVEVPENQLTDNERRAAYVTAFYIYD